MPSGGKRPGAGRPKGAKTRRTAPSEPSGKSYASVLDYLRAVALGSEPADALRIAAAKAALPFEAPRQRAPVKALPARQRQAAQEMAEQSADQAEWLAKAQAIRAKHGKGKSP